LLVQIVGTLPDVEGEVGLEAKSDGVACCGGACRNVFSNHGAGASEPEQPGLAAPLDDPQQELEVVRCGDTAIHPAIVGSQVSV